MKSYSLYGLGGVVGVGVVDGLVPGVGLVLGGGVVGVVLGGGVVGLGEDIGGFEFGVGVGVGLGVGVGVGVG